MGEADTRDAKLEGLDVGKHERSEEPDVELHKHERFEKHEQPDVEGHVFEKNERAEKAE